MGEIVCSVDLGTTSVKACMLDADGIQVASATRPTPGNLLDRSGVELDAEEYLAATIACLADVVAAAPSRPVLAVAVTSQRATIVPVDHRCVPLGPAISWQDVRGAEAIERFTERFDRREYLRTTGLPPSALWSLAKILWLPFLAGIGTPDFDASASGLLAGLHLTTSREQVARAALEGVGFELRRILETLAETVSVTRLRVVGGAVGPVSARILADVTGRSLGVGGAVDASSRGAAILAWHRVGRFSTISEGAARWSNAEVRWLEPTSLVQVVRERYDAYRALVGRRGE